MFLFRSHLCKRSSVAIKWNEHRVVTETVIAAPRDRDHALDLTPGDNFIPVEGAGERDGREPRVARRPRKTVELAEKLRNVVGIRGVFARITSGVHTRRA